MDLLDRIHDACRLITIMGHWATDFEREILEWKSGGGPEAVAATEQRATTIEQQVTDLRAKNEKLLVELIEVTQRLEFSDKELNDASADLCDTQRQLKEQQAANLPKQAVEEYKDSIKFKLGMHRMGRVSYEYGYQLMLARFQAQYLDFEVEENPFTIQPEDNSVPMKIKQPFDDSEEPES
ncbi:hypothetical protein BHM03_00038216 [Ensete ventricosum]|nr:hypothetical protein BHM03_00038216 [Ensete ventricosum]